MSQHDADRRTPTKPRELVAAHRRHGDDRGERRDRFDPVNVALAAWTDADGNRPEVARPARADHPTPRQRQPWLPAGGGGRVDPRDVARAALAAQAAAAATETEEHRITDEDARPGLISRLAGRVRDARPRDDAQPDAGTPAPTRTAAAAAGTAEHRSEAETSSSVEPRS